MPPTFSQFFKAVVGHIGPEKAGIATTWPAQIWSVLLWRMFTIQPVAE